MNRATFDGVLEQTTEPYRIVDRLTGEEVLLSRLDYDDLCRVHLYDWLEQVPRSREWNYRPGVPAHGRALGGSVVAVYDRVFAQETAEAVGQRTGG